MDILYTVPFKPSSNLFPIQHAFYYFLNAKRNNNTCPPIKNSCHRDLPATDYLG